MKVGILITRSADGKLAGEFLPLVDPALDEFQVIRQTGLYKKRPVVEVAVARMNSDEVTLVRRARCEPVKADK